MARWTAGVGDQVLAAIATEQAAVAAEVTRADGKYVATAGLDAATAPLVTGNGTTAGALRAAYGAVADLGIAPGHGVGNLRDLYAPSDDRPVPLTPTAEVSIFQAGHGWTIQNATPGTIADDTTVSLMGSQSLLISTTGSQGASTPTIVGKTGLPNIDLAKNDLRIRVRIENGAQIAANGLQLLAGSSGFTSNFVARAFGPLEGMTTQGSGSQYQNLGGDGAWQTYTLNFSALTTNNGFPSLSTMTAIGISLADTASGTPARVHVQEIAVVPKATAPYPHGVISFTFDDGYIEQFTAAKSYLDTYGFPATAFVIRDLITATPGAYMSLGQLQQLEQDGWEVACHANTVADHNTTGGLTGLTAQQIDDDFAAQKSWMIANGFRGRDYTAYPQGYYNDTVVAAAARYFTAARTTEWSDGIETFPPADPMRVRCVALADSTGYTLTAYKALVDDIYTYGGWINFYTHKVTGTPSGIQVSPAIFNGLVDYIATKGVPVRTFGDVIRAGTATVQASLQTALPGVANPVDYGLTGWSIDPAMAGVGINLPTAGVALGCRIQDTPGAIRNAVNLNVTTAGTGLANTFMAVYNSSGAKLQGSFDRSTDLQTTGAKKLTTNSPFVVPADGVLIAIIFCGTATTLPGISGCNAGPAANFSYPGTNRNARAFTTGSGLTAAPSSIPVTALSTSNAIPWMASST